MFSEVICSVISGCCQNVFFALGKVLFHFYVYALDQGSFAHWFYDPGGSKDGDSSDDPEAGVEGFFADLYAFRDRDYDFQSAFVIVFFGCFCGFAQDHCFWDGVDGCFSDFLGEARFGDSSDADSSVEKDSGSFGFLYGGVDQNSVGCVGVISGVFLNGAGYFVRFCVNVFELQSQKDSFGSHQRYCFPFLSAQEYFCGAFARGSGTGACRVAESHFFVSADHVVIFQSVFHEFSF